MLSPQQMYTQALESGQLLQDQDQALAVKLLQSLYEALVLKKEKATGLLPKLLRSTVHKRRIKGIYFWGSVGRGKTCLMDMFFQSVPGDRKKRIHFHRFMRMVHDRLKDLPGQKNPLEIIGKELADQIDLLCFDEFFVTEIGDAMLLSGLLQSLFDAGVVLVATSNVPPHRLYENGLQREPFLPAIALIESNTQVVNLDGSKDYRLRNLQQAELFFSPLDDRAELSLNECFDRLAGQQLRKVNCEISVLGRRIKCRVRTEDIVWFEFSEICEGPRSTNDYIEIAREFHTVLVSGVPAFLTVKNDNAARRFIALVDEFYDHNVKLVLSAEASIDGLYQGKELAFPFQRTVSRLLEMQSQNYLSSEHRP